MTERVTYHCATCGKPYVGSAAVLPPGWHRFNGALICDDCEVSLSPELSKKARDEIRYWLNLNQRVANAAADKPDITRCESAITLRSGSYLDLIDPDCSVIQPVDIAAGLRQARFAAQTRDFYTIAQHSLLVLRLVSPIARKLGGEKGLQLKRCALMHDAAEAFIHDITQPLKRALPDYRKVEARLESRLAAQFGWHWTNYRRDAVKLADIQALAIEQRDLLHVEEPWPVFDRIDRSKLTSIRITRTWHVDEAQDRFLTAFNDLFPQTERKAA